MKGANQIQKNAEIAEMEMIPYLRKMQESGVDLFVDGEAVRFEEVVRHTIQDPCAYMADYVLDEKGAVKQIRFDRVEL